MGVKASSISPHRRARQTLKPLRVRCCGLRVASEIDDDFRVAMDPVKADNG